MIFPVGKTIVFIPDSGGSSGHGASTNEMLGILISINIICGLGLLISYFYARHKDKMYDYWWMFVPFMTGSLAGIIDTVALIVFIGSLFF